MIGGHDGTWGWEWISVMINLVFSSLHMVIHFYPLFKWLMYLQLHLRWCCLKWIRESSVELEFFFKIWGNKEQFVENFISPPLSKKIKQKGAPGCSVKCLPSSQVMISGSWYWALCQAPSSSGSLLLPLSLPFPPAHSFSPSLSQNK